MSVRKIGIFEIFDPRANEMFIKFREIEFSACSYFVMRELWKFEYIFFPPMGGENIEEEKRLISHSDRLREPERTSDVYISFLTRSDESAASIIE